MDLKLIIIKMSILPKIIYRIITIPIKIPEVYYFFFEIDKQILKYIHGIANNLEYHDKLEKEPSDRTFLPDLKT